MSARKKRTLIKNARYVVVFDGTEHRLLEDGLVLVEGNTIDYVGRETPDGVDEYVDAQGGLVMPGFVNMHCHMGAAPNEKGFLEDKGSSKFYMSGLYEYLPVTYVPYEDELHGYRFSVVDLLKGGTTTVFQIDRWNEEILEIIAQSGIRVYMGYGYRSGGWYTRDGKQLDYRWDEEAGMKGLEKAAELFRKHDGSYDGRVNVALCPMQVDTCTPELLRATREVADDLGARVQIHAAQAVTEFQEILRRYGMTPAEFLDSCGISGPDVIYGHYMFPSHHTWCVYKEGDDLGLISKTGTSVAHCPWVFGRRGIIMESFDRYLSRGINMTIGTDTFPQDMIAEMKWAAVFSKVAEGNPERGTAAQVFNAATLGGAKALGRDNLGRICPGAKADIVIADCNNMLMRPLRDPIKALIYTGGSRAIKTVMVDGRVLVQDGEVIGVDEADLWMRIQEVGERMHASVPDHDWARRSHLEMSPMSFAPID